MPTLNAPETRSHPGRVELRAAPNGARRIYGYAARFEELSEDLGGWREIIDPGFFDGVMSDDVRALWQHEPAYVLGRTAAGTAWLTLDEAGLRYEADPPATGWANDALASIERGDVSESSFSFYVAEDRWDVVGNVVIRRLLKAERLFDVSPVTFPAYPTTSIAVSQRAAELRAQLPATPISSLIQQQAPAGAGLDLLDRYIQLMEHSR
jgi:HK97 family phage prohead protease